MSRCKHGRVTLTERISAFSEWVFQDGRVEGEGWSDGHSTGHYFWKCSVCGVEGHGMDGRLPKWAQKLVDEMESQKLKRLRSY